MWIPADKINGHGGLCECDECHRLDYATDEEIETFKKNRKIED